MADFHIILSPEGVARGTQPPQWPTTAAELFAWLPCTLELAPGTRVADLVRLCQIDTPELLSPLFACDVPAFLEQAAGPPSMDAEPSGMTEVRVTLEVDGPRRDEAAALSWVCDGWGVWELDPHLDPDGTGPREGGFAIDFTPLSDLLAYPVRILDHARVPSSRADDAPTVTIQQRPRLWDVLQAFWWEIGFHGTPERTAQQLASLRASLSEVDLDAERVADGLPSRFIPADVVFAQLRERLGLPAVDTGEVVDETAEAEDAR